MEDKQKLLCTGAALCGFGLVSAVIVSLLDTYGMQRLGKRSHLQEQSRKVRITDVKHFPLTFWILVLTSLFFYCGYFAFLSNSSEYFQEKYGYTDTTSTRISGAVYYVAIVMSPILGCLVDRFGYRAAGYLVGTVLNIPVFAVLAYTSVIPLIFTITLGFSVSIAAAIVKSSIPLLVHESMIGTALGLTYSADCIAIGICDLVIGGILGSKNDASLSKQQKLLRWQHVMIFLLSTAVLCVVFAALLVFTDRKKGDGILDRCTKSKRLNKEAQYLGNNDEKSLLVPKMAIND